MKTRILHLLIVEDEEAHVEAIRRAYEEAGVAVEIQSVGTLNEFRAYMRNGQPDLVLMDMNLPDGNAMELLTHQPGDAPFLFLVMTAFGDQKIAVDAMKAGALDYVVKSSEAFTDMPRTVERSMREWELVQKQKRAEEAERMSEARFSTVFHASPLSISITRLKDGVLLDVNSTWEKVTGFNRAEVIGRKSVELNIWIDADQRKRLVGNMCKHGAEHDGFDVQVRQKSGEIRDIFILAEQIDFAGEPCMLTMAMDITARKRAEVTLKEAKAFTESALNAIPDIFYSFDLSGKFLSWNKTFSRISGYSDQELSLKKPTDFFSGEDVQRIAGTIERIHKEGTSKVEANFVIKDGRQITCEFTGSELKDAKGNIIGFSGTGRDITERKQAEATLRESEARYRILFEDARDGIALADAETDRLVDCNQALCLMVERDKAELVGQAQSILHPPEDLIEGMSHSFRQLKVDKSEHSLEDKLLSKGGRLIPVEIRATRIQINGRDFLLGIFRDITERKQVTEALKTSEERFRTAAENLTDVVYDWDIKENVYWYGDIDGIMGYPPGGFSRSIEGWAATLHPEDKNRVMAALESHLKGVAPFVVEYRIGRRDGEWRWLSARGTALRDDRGEPYKMVGSITDITERKKAEEEIKRNYEIQAAMNALLKLSIEINNEKEFLDSALNLLLSLKWLSFESKGAVFLADESKKTLHLQVHRGFSEELLAACSTVPFGKCLCGIAAAERTIQFADCIDGQHVTHVEGMSPHGHYCVPILSGDNVLGVINLYVREGHIRDLKEIEFLMAIANVFASVIERKRAEEKRIKLETQLRQSQKMEAIGQLAGGIAHDFNNMLSIINGYSEMILSELPPSSQNYSNIQEISKAGRRSADLTRQLLAFASKQAINPKVLDLNDTVEGMLKLLRRLIGENIKLLWEPAVNLWKVKMDPSQLDQILANLLVNTRDAISGAGKVIIKTGNAEFDEAFRAMHRDFVLKKYVVLEVGDNGSGMDKETLAHIYEPFFTTKEAGKGTGLGLATVFGIVKQNNGFINVYSELGKGTIFKIYLPPHESEDAESDGNSKKQELFTGNETVMLVEDEMALLIFARMQLERLGYAVLDADSPVKAIKLAEEYKGEIHILMTDVVMPEMSGRELKKKINIIRPGIKCLFMSGYTADIIANKGVLDDGIHFLQKPFTAEDLSIKLREALA